MQNDEIEPVPFDSEEAWLSLPSSDGPAGEIRWGPDSMPPRADVHDDHGDDMHDDHQNMAFNAAVVPDTYAYDTAGAGTAAVPVKKEPVANKKLVSGAHGNGDAFGGLKPTTHSFDKRDSRRPPRAPGASTPHGPSHAAGMFGVLVLASIVGYYAIKRGGYSQFMNRAGGGLQKVAHKSGFPTACKAAFVRIR